MYFEGLSSTTRIDELKLRVMHREGYPPGEQRLIHAGKQLEDGKMVTSRTSKAG